MQRTWMHGLRQLHELMLCAEAAEHQLTSISDAAEITDTYPTPPDEVQSAHCQTTESTRWQVCYLKWRSQHHENKCNEYC